MKYDCTGAASRQHLDCTREQGKLQLWTFTMHPPTALTKFWSQFENQNQNKYFDVLWTANRAKEIQNSTETRWIISKFFLLFIHCNLPSGYWYDCGSESWVYKRRVFWNSKLNYLSYHLSFMKVRLIHSLITSWNSIPAFREELCSVHMRDYGDTL